MACPISSSKCSCHLSGDSTTPSRVINKPAMTFLTLNTPLMLISYRDILRFRKYADSAIQPERVARSGRQVHPAIHQPACGQMWQKRAQLQQDANPLSLCRSVSHRSGFGLGTPQRHGDLALESAHYELTVVHGNREKRPLALTMTAPDPFDKRRVRHSFFIDDNHASPFV